MKHTLDGCPGVPDGQSRVIGVSHEVANEFPGMWARPTCGLMMKGTKLMCGYLSNLFFSALLAMSPGFVLAAETRDGLQEKGATIETPKYVTEPLRFETRSIRACSVCPLTTRVRAGTSCSMNAVRLNDVRKASRHCCMPAVNTSSVPTSVAVMLLRIHWFVADEDCGTFLGARLYNVCGVGGRRVREHQSSGY